MKLLNKDESLRAYLRELSRAGLAPLTDDEARELVSLEPISEATRKRLAEGSLQQVVSIAWEFEDSGKHMLDVIQEGNIGLLTAIETVSANEQTHFSHYVRECVEQQIRRFIAGDTPTEI